jgi:zinc transport system substrate-binding protein
MLRHLLLLLILVVSLPAAAAPRVVVSIGPLHSLVAGVMQGVGEPQLLIPAGASPHAYALKPSDARALSSAELVVWIGPELETMVDRPLRNLAADARTLELFAVEGMTLLPARRGGVWLAQPEGEGAHDHEGPDHTGGEPAHEEHGHHHGAVDTHLWLSPHNARRIVAAVTDELVRLDPDNAGRYRRNAVALDGRIVQLEQALARQLAPLHAQRYIVFHDAYHYFEEAFGLQPAGAIAVSPDKRPGARRLLEIRQAIRDSGARCVFSEPQFRPDLVEVVLEGTAARPGVLDPLGATLPPGKELWFTLMQRLADSLSRCLEGAQ